MTQSLPQKVHAPLPGRWKSGGIDPVGAPAAGFPPTTFMRPSGPNPSGKMSTRRGAITFWIPASLNIYRSRGPVAGWKPGSIRGLPIAIVTE